MPSTKSVGSLAACLHSLPCFFPVGLGNLRSSGPDLYGDTKIFIDYRGKSVQSLNNSAGQGRVISLRRRYVFLGSFWL